MKKINSKSVAAAIFLAGTIAFVAGMQGCSKESKAAKAAVEGAVEKTENKADVEPAEVQDTVSVVSEEVKTVAADVNTAAESVAENTAENQPVAAVEPVKEMKVVPVKHEHGDKASIAKVTAKAVTVGEAENLTGAAPVPKTATVTELSASVEKKEVVQLTGAAPVPKKTTMTELSKTVKDKDVNVTVSTNTDKKDNNKPEAKPSKDKKHGHKGPECGPAMPGCKGPKGPAHDNGHHFGNHKGDHHMDKHGHGPHHEGHGPKDHHEHHGPEHHGHDGHGHQGHHEGPCGRR